MWIEGKGHNATPVSQDVFQITFFDRFFPHKMREDKVEDLMNLGQGSIFVKEYCLKFTQLSKYAPKLLLDSRARMSKFVIGVSNLLVNERRTVMLIGDMNFYLLMPHAQQIEAEKVKKDKERQRRLGPDNLIMVDINQEREIVLSFRAIHQHLHHLQQGPPHLGLSSSNRVEIRPLDLRVAFLGNMFFFL